VHVLLAQLERCVAGKGPPDRIVVVGPRLAELINALEVPLDGLGRLAGEDRDALLVEQAVERALARGAVVADEHEQERVVELAGLLEEVDDPTDLGVGVLHVAGVDLGHPSEQLLLVRRQVVPGRHALEHRRQLRRLGDDAQLLLPGQGLLPVGVPPHVELALVAVGPLRPDMMRRMHRPESEVGQPRLLRGYRLVLSDPADRLVGKVLREVVAVLRQPGLVDRLSVHEQLRVPLVRVAAEEAVEPVEAEHRTDWPPVVRPRDTRLLRRRVVPLPQAEARVAVLVQHRGDAGLVLWLRAL
jgi:hypothetical protein